MGSVLVSVLFLLVVGWICSEGFIFLPFHLFDSLQSLSFYVFIAIGILLAGWIVGD